MLKRENIILIIFYSFLLSFSTSLSLNETNAITDLINAIPNLKNTGSYWNLDEVANACNTANFYGLQCLNSHVVWLYLETHSGGSLPFDLGTGTIPLSIGNFAYLTSLSVLNSEVGGQIPSTIGNIPLTYLDLKYNQFNGTIPSEIGSLINLTYLDLSFNQLNGTIPSTMGDLTSLTYLDLSHNLLTGTIPNIIGDLTSLTYLDLSYNQFNGTIPSTISDLKNLKYLDLSQNNLTGTIPNISATNTESPSSSGSSTATNTGSPSSSDSSTATNTESPSSSSISYIYVYFHLFKMIILFTI